MFKLLRSKAKFFYWIIAISFILFMGLTNMGGQGCQTSLQKGPAPGVIGSVNGTKIHAQEYDRYYRSLLAQMRQQSPNRDLNPNQYANARQRAWDDIVRSRIMDQAIMDNKIKVTDEELLDRFENNPPPQVLVNFRNPETGQIDMDLYYQALKDPEVDWSGIENYVRDLMRREKLKEFLTADITVSEDEIRKEYIRQTGRAVVEYTGAVYRNIKDDYSPSDEEISAWYESHQDDYQQPARARCEFVRFPKEPSEADYADILQFINEIREEIVSGTKTFEEAAADYSDDPSASRGGDLGTFDRKRMVPAFTEVAFSLPEGEISQPVKTRFGYHLIQVIEQHKDEVTGEVFEVHARHILLKVVPGTETLAMINEKAQEFADRVDGASFASTAQAEGLDLSTPAPFAEGRDIPGLSFSLAGANWAHHAQEGKISQVFENEDCFYVVHALGVIPAGVGSLEEVRNQVSFAVTREHQHQLGLELLNPVVGKIQMGEAMADAAAGTELFYAVSDTFGVNDNVRNVGYGTEFNELAINGEVGLLIPEVATPSGVFALIPLWIKPFDEADFESRRSGIQTALLARKQNEYVENWLQEQVAAADIKDYRQSYR